MIQIKIGKLFVLTQETSSFWKWGRRRPRREAAPRRRMLSGCPASPPACGESLASRDARTHIPPARASSAAGRRAPPSRPTSPFPLPPGLASAAARDLAAGRASRGAPCGDAQPQAGDLPTRSRNSPLAAALLRGPEPLSAGGRRWKRRLTLNLTAHHPLLLLFFPFIPCRSLCRAQSCFQEEMRENRVLRVFRGATGSLPLKRGWGGRARWKQVVCGTCEENPARWPRGRSRNDTPPRPTPPGTGAPSWVGCLRSDGLIAGLGSWHAGRSTGPRSAGVTVAAVLRQL